MPDGMGQSPASHEGTDTDEPITYSAMAEAICDVETRLRREHAEKRAAFEERLIRQITELLDEKLKDHVRLETIQ